MARAITSCLFILASSLGRSKRSLGKSFVSSADFSALFRLAYTNYFWQFISIYELVCNGNPLWQTGEFFHQLQNTLPHLVQMEQRRCNTGETLQPAFCVHFR